MKTERRWLKSVIEAACQPIPALPWEHHNSPDQTAQPARSATLAAR